MKKARKYLCVAMLVFSLCISLFGCSMKMKTNTTKTNGSNANLESVPLETAENLFASTEKSEFESESEFMPFYGIENQIYDEEKDVWCIGYEGGELQIDVGTQVSQGFFQYDSSEAEFGIQIWIDGVPQAFRIDDENEYAYMQTYILTADQPRMISCFFVPTVGEKGDMLSVEVSQFWYPSCQPDFVEYSGYDSYRLWPCIAARSEVKYEATPENIEVKAKMEDCVLDSSLEQKQLTLEEWEAYGEEMGYLPTDTSWQENINYRLWVNGEEGQNYMIDGMDTIKVRLEIFGPVGVNVDCGLYLNHIPLEGDWEEIRQMQIAVGELIILEAELDVTQLEGINEFYAVIVPIDEFVDENGYRNVQFGKTYSCCLYHESDLASAE